MGRSTKSSSQRSRSTSSPSPSVLRELVLRLQAFQREAHSVLSVHETSSASRLVQLEKSYKDLGALSLRQDELLRQALRCVESELFRAAHVMAWAGFMDFLEEKLASDGLKRLRGVRPKWKASSVEELRENTGEYQLIEAARDLGLCSKTEMKAFHGLLNKRNECAHPSDHFPLLNETLGYIAEILQRIGRLQPRKL
jgi:hypothetical protein